MKIAVAVLIVLYVVGVIAMWRISTFLCMKRQWLSVIPIVQLIYFASISDHVSTEVKDGFKYSTPLVVVFLGLALLGFILMSTLPYDATILGGRLLVSMCIVAGVLVLIYCFVNVIVNSTDHSITMCLCALIIPFPVILFMSSFLLPTYMEETLMLYMEE